MFPFPFFYFSTLAGLFYLRSKITVHKKPNWPIVLHLIFGIISTDIIASQIMASLEDRFPRQSIDDLQPADAAFVLGGITNTLAKVDNEPQFTDGADRLFAAIDLYKAGKVRYIILTGKSALIDHKGIAESEELAEYLVKRGFRKEDIITDRESQNTIENYQNGLRLAQEKNLHSFYLITSAFHMQRAMTTADQVIGQAFAGASFIMMPFPVDYRSDRITSGIEAFFPSAHAILKASLAIKEYIGIVAYQVRDLLIAK